MNTAVTEFKQHESNLLSFIHEKDLAGLAPGFMDNADKDRYQRKVALAVANDDKLKACFQSKEGTISIVEAIRTCFEQGLVPGKECYLVPFKRKLPDGRTVHEVSFMPTKTGIIKQLTFGSDPVFKTVRSWLVYENDDVSLNEGTGEVSVNLTFSRQGRGGLLGVIIQFEKTDGDKHARFWDLARIEKVRDNHSKSYRNYLISKAEYDEAVATAGKKDSIYKKKTKYGKVTYYIPDAFGKGKDKEIYEPALTAWHTDFEKMAEKTVIKSEAGIFAQLAESFDVTRDPDYIDHQKTTTEKADDLLSGAIIEAESAEVHEDSNEPDSENYDNSGDNVESEPQGDSAILGGD
jgi:recombinational DNA repair protein RecT